METKILNVQVYGLEESIVRCRYPMMTEVPKMSPIDVKKYETYDLHFYDDVVTSGEFVLDLESPEVKRAQSLGSARPASGHDKYLRGIIVQFDLIAPRYFWQEWDTYHFHESISSQSTMHCIGKFNVDQMVNHKYIDKVILSRFKELVQLYNSSPTIENLLLVKHNMPEGIHIGRGISTNYAQLKTIYSQRWNHRLPDWSQVVCPWILQLPYFSELTGIKEEC